MGKLITIEGMSGSGKTYYFNKLKEDFKDDDRIYFNGEITDGNHENYGSKIFDILFSNKSRFFDIGNPKAETLLITAKQALDEDNYILPALNDDKIVISDRGFDTICILEGIMYTKKYGGNLSDNINMLYDSLCLFNRVPDITILLDGDINKAIRRAEIRDNLAYTSEERLILENSARLYREKALEDRFVLINRDQDCDVVYQEIKNVISNELEKKGRYVYEKNNISNR